jgi:hypothetical protein
MAVRRTSEIDFELQFDPSDIQIFIGQYWSMVSEGHRQNEREIEEIIAPHVRQRKHFLREEFLKVCEWKSPRPRKHFESNTKEIVIRLTRQALSERDGVTRVDSLLELKGVRLPTASVFLHFGAVEPYPIIDIMALQSLGLSETEAVKYRELGSGKSRYGFWWKYVTHCRRLATELRVTMRDLDRALWAYPERKSSKGKNC